jgi:hypothetical protein
MLHGPDNRPPHIPGPRIIPGPIMKPGPQSRPDRGVVLSDFVSAPFEVEEAAGDPGDCAGDWVATKTPPAQISAAKETETRKRLAFCVMLMRASLHAIRSTRVLLAVSDEYFLHITRAQLCLDLDQSGASPTKSRFDSRPRRSDSAWCLALELMRVKVIETRSDIHKKQRRLSR